MKAKELAAQLLKHPDFDVEFDVVAKRSTVDHPWADHVLFRVCGIEDVAHSSKVIVLETEEVVR